MSDNHLEEPIVSFDEELRSKFQDSQIEEFVDLVEPEGDDFRAEFLRQLLQTVQSTPVYGGELAGVAMGRHFAATEKKELQKLRKALGQVESALDGLSVGAIGHIHAANPEKLLERAGAASPYGTAPWMLAKMLPVRARTGPKIANARPERLLVDLAKAVVAAGIAVDEALGNLQPRGGGPSRLHVREETRALVDELMTLYWATTGRETVGTRLADAKARRFIKLVAGHLGVALSVTPSKSLEARLDRLLAARDAEAEPVQWISKQLVDLRGRRLELQAKAAEVSVRTAADAKPPTSQHPMATKHELKAYAEISRALSTPGPTEAT